MKTTLLTTLIILAFAANGIAGGNAGGDKDKNAIADVVGKPTGIVVKGQVWNMDGKKKLNQPMNGCEITVFDSRYNLLQSLDTKNNGTFALFLKPSTSYIVIVKKPGYLSKRIKIVTPNTDTTTGKEMLNLVLRSIESYTLSTSR
jgi:hypothetical protein